jgi:hypothetical protein
MMFIHRKKLDWYCKENCREIVPAVMKKVVQMSFRILQEWRPHGRPRRRLHASIILKMVIKK